MYTIGVFLRKNVPIGSERHGGHKRTTGEAGVATTGVFRELDWDYSGN